MRRWAAFAFLLSLACLPHAAPEHQAAAEGWQSPGPQAAFIITEGRSGRWDVGLRLASQYIFLVVSLIASSNELAGIRCNSAPAPSLASC